jgi:Right handed beta helix region
MNSLHSVLICSLCALLLACGDDDSKDTGGSVTGGDGGSSGQGGGAGGDAGATGGSAGATGGSAGATGGSAAATGGAGGASGAGNCPAIEPDLCEAPAGSACYYVDPAGSDDGAGTYADPWRTLHNVNLSIYSSVRPATWKELHPGDHVYLMDGVHDAVYHPGDDSGTQGGGSFLLYVRGLHGEEGKPVVFKGYPGHRPILDIDGAGRAIQVEASSHVRLEGLEVRDAWNRGIRLAGSDQVSVSRVLVHDTDGTVADNVAGFEVLGSTNVEVSDSVFYDNYDRTAAANGVQTHNSGNFVLFGGANIEVHHCIFYMTGDPAGQSSGFGIKYKHASTDPTGWFHLHDSYFENHKYFAIGLGTAHAHVHHNVINGAPTAIVDQDHGGTTHQSDQVFEFNTINDARGLYVSPTLDWVDHDNGPWTELVDIVFRNNIVVDTTDTFTSDSRTMMLNAYMDDALFLAVRDGISFEQNCYQNTSQPVSFGFAEATGQGALGGFYDLAGWQSEYGYDVGSLEADPGFADPAGMDFTPAPGGSCADKGALTDGHVPPFDKEMVFRCAGL